MQIAFEESIPKGLEYFSSLAPTVSFRAGGIDNIDLTDVTHLAVRSTTQVNASLLARAPHLQLVATATAGIDHFNIKDLTANGIHYASAAGCNAVAVAEYVISALLAAEQDLAMPWSDICVGVVGAGHVGSALSARLTWLGINHKLYDPPLQRAGDQRQFCSFSEILTCDVITLHVPFSRNGQDATEHLINAKVLSQLSPQQLLINASRGEVVHELALLDACDEGRAPRLILDVFQQEPNINNELVDATWLATPHIAGHSVEGKLRGTQQVYETFCRAVGGDASLSMSDFLAPAPRYQASENPLPFTTLKAFMHATYDIRQDSSLFKASTIDSATFLALRKHYRTRWEYSSCKVELSHHAHTLSLLDAIQKNFGQQLSR